MKRLLLFGGFLFLLLNVSLAQCPSGTTQIEFHNASSAPAGWTVDDQRSGYWLLSDDAGSTPNGEGVISAAIDVSAFNTITVNMEVATFGSGTARPGIIEFSTDGGITFDANAFVTNTPSSSSYIDGGDFTFSVPASTTNLVLRFSRENSGTGRDVRARRIYICGDNVSTNPTVSFAATTSAVTEGNTGTTTHTVDVTMDAAPNLTVTVDVTDAGTGDADASDFSYTTTQLTFDPLETYPNTKSVNVTINGDTDVEPDETINLMLALAATNLGTADIGDDMHQITITNDDIPTEVNLASATLSVAEGGSVQLCVDITNPSATVATTADIVLTSAAAPHFDGYTTQSVTFAAGSSAQECVTLATDAANGITDTNNTYTFDLQNVAGGTSAAAGAMTQATVTVTDDVAPPLAKGLYLNELSNGPTGGQEFMEFVVTGTAGETVDLRGWIFDDNNGDFGTGGIAGGHIKFSQDCNWENVPVGSIILVYNFSDKNTNIVAADDPTDANLDLVYICPIKTTGDGGNVPYFEGHTTLPSSSSQSYPNMTSGSPNWTDITLGNSVDVGQVRQPDGTLVHGVSYGTNNSLENTYPHFPGSGGGQNYAFTHDTGNDFNDVNNWTQSAASTGDTPGTFNNAANQTFIENLQNPVYPIENLPATRTCPLGPNQSRFYFDESDGNSIIFFIQNNVATDYGSSTASVEFSASSNENMTESVFQFSTVWQFTPTTSTPADYNIRFYVPQTDWDNYVAYLNAQPNSTADHSAASVLSECLVYTYDDADDPASATSTDAQSPTTGTYTVGGIDYYTFETNFTHFSQYRIGMPAAQVLPVELLDFSAKKVDQSAIQLTWKTATEANNDYFILESSTDSERFVEIAKINGNGTTTNMQTYQFLDKNPANGVNYYRLKQVDLDGAYAYSHIVSEKIGSNPTISIRPTLVADEMTVELTEAANTEVLLEIYDLQGRLILTNQIADGATAIDLTMTELTKGTYVLKANQGGAISTLRFVKL